MQHQLTQVLACRKLPNLATSIHARADIIDWMSAGSDAFSAAFRRARERHGWTYRVAAKKLGISTRTIQNWQNGEHPAALFVDKRVKSAVANMLGIPESELLAMLGVLNHPPQLAGESEPRKIVLAPASGAASPATATSLRSALYDVMSAISDAHPDWLRLEKIARRGTLAIIPFHALLGIVPHGRDLDEIGAYAGIKSYLMNGILRPIWNQVGCHWRSGHPPGWESAPELLIQIPAQERTRPISLPRNRLAGSLQVFVIGKPWGHAELLGSFIADALSFGYIDLRYPGRLNEATAADADPTRHVAQALRWSRPGYVVSLASPDHAKSHYMLAKDVAARSVVVLCTYESMMESVGRWVYGYSAQEERFFDDLVDEVKRDHNSVIQVHFTDDDFSGLHFYGDIVQQELSDRACDLSLAAAVDVVRLLSSRYQHVPPPERWTGYMSNVCDSRGRLNWERRTKYAVKWL